MHQQMQEAEDYLTELAEYYLAASLDLQDKAKDILRRFWLKHNLTQHEAEMLLANIDPSDIKKILERLEKDPKNKELRDELTAQAAAARIRNLESLFEQVKKTTSSLAEKVKTGASKLLKKLGLDSWHKAVFNLQKQVGAGWKVKSPSEKLVEKAVEQSWAGSGFSKRIWGNTEELEKAVKKEIMKSLLTGRPTEEAAKAINDQFGKGMYNARRLVRTEAAYITNQMALQGYRDQGVEKYVYVAILDLRTSKICRSLDKKRFLVKNAKVGVNFPPMHPFCRSTTVPWVSDALLRRMKQKAYDPRTGKYVMVPGDMTYGQWYKQFVEGQPAEKKPTQERSLTLDQYNRYKERLGDDFDYSYDEFLKAKGDPQIWADLQQKYKDARQYEDYKALMGDKIPDSLDMFRDLKYNNPDRWQYIQDLRTYLKKYPNSDSRYFDAMEQLKAKGIKTGVYLPPVQKQAFILPSGKKDPYHIMHRMMQRGISDDGLRDLMKNAKVMASQGGGTRQLFIGEDGFVVITKVDDDWLFKTAWTKADFDESSYTILEVLKNVGL